MKFKNKVKVFLITYFLAMSSYAQDSIYFENISAPYPTTRAVWKTSRPFLMEMTYFYNELTHQVKCVDIGTKSCDELVYVASKYPSYAAMLNKINTASSEDKWQLYLEVNEAGGKKTYFLDVNKKS